jgi:CRP-like cAMP-binding protein
VVDEERRKRVGRLEPGDLFGGVALVRRAPSAASVIAAGKCWVLVLPEPTLRGVLARRPGLEDRLRRAPAPGAGGRPAV